MISIRHWLFLNQKPQIKDDVVFFIDCEIFFWGLVNHIDQCFELLFDLENLDVNYIFFIVNFQFIIDQKIINLMGNLKANIYFVLEKKKNNLIDEKLYFKNQIVGESFEKVLVKKLQFKSIVIRDNKQLFWLMANMYKNGSNIPLAVSIEYQQLAEIKILMAELFIVQLFICKVPLKITLKFSSWQYLVKTALKILKLDYFYADKN